MLKDNITLLLGLFTLLFVLIREFILYRKSIEEKELDQTKHKVEKLKNELEKVVKSHLQLLMVEEYFYDLIKQNKTKDATKNRVRKTINKDDQDKILTKSQLKRAIYD